MSGRMGNRLLFGDCSNGGGKQGASVSLSEGGAGLGLRVDSGSGVESGRAVDSGSGQGLGAHTILGEEIIGGKRSWICLYLMG